MATSSSASPAPWLLLQLVDSAFPAGGFAHSAGLEAAIHLRGTRDVEPFVHEALWQAARGTLPFVSDACRYPRELARLDALFDAFCTSHVANRASRAQGRALAMAASRVFERPELAALAMHARTGPAHQAPMFGAVFGLLGVGVEDTRIAWLHGVMRTVLSAAVRLNVVGPLEAQQVQAACAPLLDEMLASCMDVGSAEAAQTAPLVELFGALHERLDGRLFQS